VPDFAEMRCVSRENAACLCCRSAAGVGVMDASGAGWARSGSLLKKPVMLCPGRITLNAGATIGSFHLPNRAHPPVQWVRSSAPSPPFIQVAVNFCFTPLPEAEGLAGRSEVHKLVIHCQADPTDLLGVIKWADSPAHVRSMLD
jgi:hypothetical protein